MAKRSASGNGTVRKKEVFRKGKKYVYWEARYTLGTDPGTGKQIQKSITGKTQKEVAFKLKEITLKVDRQIYIEPSKLTLAQWLNIWLSEYVNNIKLSTQTAYASAIKNHIVPALGNIKIKELRPDVIQKFVNGLSKTDGSPLSAKTIKNIYGVLHKALSQALIIGYIQTNPAANCILPKQIKPKIQPLDAQEISSFLNAINDSRFKRLFIFTLFTGLRKAEVMGLQWDCVDIKNSTVIIDKQLQYVRSKHRYELVPTKNSKPRTLFLPPHIIKLLKSQKAFQAQCALKNAPVWQNTLNLVFTDEIGHHLTLTPLIYDFKKCAAKMGRPDLRFHDLRHTYAVSSLRSGDDIKTVQENLGHSSAAFTLDVYAHATTQMKKESAQRMEKFIENIMS